MSNVRLGIVLTVTGLIALEHWALGATHHLSADWVLLVGVLLAAAGIPFLVVAARYGTRNGGGPKG